MDRVRKNEFSKNKQSTILTKLNNEFVLKCSDAKRKYYANIVSDLKESNPAKWHSKLKRMSGQETYRKSNIVVDELAGLPDQEQADRIAEHYAKVSNQYEDIQSEDYPEYKISSFALQQ